MKGFLLAILLAAGMSIRAATPGEDAAATVVIYNANDRESKELADFYCTSRGIDSSNQIAVRAPVAEEITRDEYDSCIATPLRKELIGRGRWLVTLDLMNRPIIYASFVRYAVLIRGIPLKIKQCQDYPGDAKCQPDPYGGINASSVDSEIAILGLSSPQISGTLNNPVFQEDYRQLAEGKDVPPAMLLVTRLDAPTAATVRAMVTNGLKAEKDGIWGWGYVDLRSVEGQGYVRGDQWIREAAESMRRKGIPVLSDDLPETVPEGFPVTDAAAYYGWYAENIDGPFAEPGFRFLPGAVAVHLHSFSASTLRNPRKGWTGPLLELGASASLGNVFEPYLPFTTHLGVFASSLLSGRNLAESYYAAQPVLSWMSICVGDPLYRPYSEFHAPQSDFPENLWSDYQRIILAHDGDTLAAARDLKFRAEEKQESLYLEGLGAAQLDAGDAVRAEESFKAASLIEKNPTILFRLLLEQARAIEKQGRGKVAAGLLKENLGHFAQPDQQALLRSWIKRMESSTNQP